MEMAFLSFFLYALLLLQFSLGSNAREIVENAFENNHSNVVRPKEDQDMLPNVNVFFRINDLYRGKKMLIYFGLNNDSRHTHLLSKEEDDSIPFSLSKLPYLLKYFSFPKDSLQAKAIETTLKDCEFKPKEGENKFCATSLVSMMKMVHENLGIVKPKILTTKILNPTRTLFQRYTFVKKPVEINHTKMVVCHTMAYPYVVYYCHGHLSQVSSVRMFKIALEGENEDRMEALAVCHMDTSMMNPDYVAFRLLGGHPGSGPVCHFLPPDNLVWVEST